MFYDAIILVPTISLITAVIVKGIVVCVKTGEINISRALSTGGMPSVHTSVVVSLATAIALKQGIASDDFAIAMTFTVIVVYDALNVRYQAGLHAQALNKIAGKKEFKESLGHLPSEAFAGAILGILVAVILYYI